MRKEKLYEILGDIDEVYAKQARQTGQKKSHPIWLRWGAAAACLAAMLVAVVLLPVLEDPEIPIETEKIFGETAFYQRYVYSVDEGRFSGYVGGKVIDEEKLGSKLEMVTVTACWNSPEGAQLSQESLRAQVYAIEGISQDVAVALRFIDKGDAVTTVHYYVIMDPTADLSVVREYVIQPDRPNNPGEE